MSDVDREIGRNIRRVREDAGISQAELAKRLNDLGATGFYPQTITKIEKGDRALKFSEAVTVAGALNVDLSILEPLPMDEDEMERYLARIQLKAARVDLTLVFREVLDALDRLHKLGLEGEATVESVVRQAINTAHEADSMSADDVERWQAGLNGLAEG